MNEPKSRPTLRITFQIDSIYGYGGWYSGFIHNGFSISFGLLSVGVWIQFTRKNYR